MTPAQYDAWAAGCGADPYHPPVWTPAQRASYEAFCRQKATDHFRWLAAQGAAVWWPRASLIDHIRAQWREASARAPVRDRYRVCPCHPRVAHGLAPRPDAPVFRVTAR